MKYKECPICGAHLDYGEKCDCEKKEVHADATAQTSKTYNNNTTKREVCQWVV